MDDPWGSPWAEEVPTNDPIAIKDKQNHGIHSDSTIQAPAKAATLEQKTNSPWNNDSGDDEFGAWSSMPTKDGLGLGFVRAEVDWMENVAENGGSPDPESLSLEWRANDVTSGELLPSPIPRSSIRQPSPDPWATEFTLNAREGKKVDGQQMPNGEPLVIEDDTVDISTKEAEIATLDAGVQDTSQELGRPGNIEDLTQNEDEAKEEGIELTVEQKLPEIDHVSSRPSSSPSEESLHEGAQQDSPRTSLEEESKRPKMPRKESSKVQELVEHFDGMAKQEEEVDTRVQDKLPVAQKGESDDDNDDFGDFEEGHSDIEESVEEVVEEDSVAKTTEQRPVTPVSPPKATTIPKTPTTPITRSGIISPNRTPKEFFGPVEIDLDLSILETLYPGAETKHAEEAVFIPDTIPHDSFSSTEQRKTWYRVSRYGTMRKHNSGDDENYTRVKWSKSQMREDTLKIVARWMEEDRLSGQVILGGAGKTSSIFGWNDTKVPGIPISTAFAPKPKTNPQPNSSLDETPAHSPVISPKIRSPLSPRRQSSTKSSSMVHDSKGTPLSPVANFGWNAPRESQDTQNFAPPPLNSIPSARNSLSNLELTSSRRSTSSIRPIPLSNTILPVESPQRTPVPTFETRTSSDLPFGTSIESSIQITSANVEYDDDWGDLVSSPVVTSTPTFPQPKVLRHRKSQSLMNPPPSIIQPFTSHNDKSYSSRPKSSFDDSTIPKNRSPLSSSSNQFAMSAFEAPTTASLASQASSNTINQPVTAPTNPWDFSFFEAAPTSTPGPTLPKQITLSPTEPKGGSATRKTVTLSNVPIVAPQPQSKQKSKEESEQEKIVTSILSNLPDLSYMLKR